MKKCHTFWMAVKDKKLVPYILELFQKFGERISFHVFWFDLAEFRSLDTEVHFVFFVLLIIIANAESSEISS